MTPSSMKDHPRRFELNNEVYARPYQIMSAPLRLTHVALLSDDRARELAAIGDLCDRFGMTRPNPEAGFFICDFPLFQLRWERHTEFSTYTLSESKTSFRGKRYFSIIFIVYLFITYSSIIYSLIKN